MTEWEFLTSLYFWIPATVSMLLLKWCAVRERKIAARQNFRQDYHWNDQEDF